MPEYQKQIFQYPYPLWNVHFTEYKSYIIWHQIYMPRTPIWIEAADRYEKCCSCWLTGSMIFIWVVIAVIMVWKIVWLKSIIEINELLLTAAFLRLLLLLLSQPTWLSDYGRIRLQWKQRERDVEWDKETERGISRERDREIEM